MKSLISLFSILFFVACSTGSSSFEKVISDYKQTDPKTGQLYDLHFKMLEMSDPQKVTVADSLKILETDLINEAQNSIENYFNLLSITQKNLKAEKEKNYPSATMIEIHEKDMLKYEEKIKELKGFNPDLSLYSSKSPDEILAYILVCSYSMNDLSGRNFTEKSEFVLSPDGKSVYKSKRIKKDK